MLVMLQHGMLDMGNVTHMPHLIRTGVIMIALMDNVLYRCAGNVENVNKVHSIQLCIAIILYKIVLSCFFALVFELLFFLVCIL